MNSFFWSFAEPLRLSCWKLGSHQASPLSPSNSIRLVAESCFTCCTGTNYSAAVYLFLCKLLPTGEIHLFTVWNQIKGLEKSDVRNIYIGAKSLETGPKRSLSLVVTLQLPATGEVFIRVVVNQKVKGWDGSHLVRHTEDVACKNKDTQGHL